MIEPPLPGASISHGPQDWQILQQRGDGTAALALAGVYRASAPEFRVEARIVREADGIPVARALDWRPATLLPDSRWEITLEGIPRGGLYRVETRVWRNRAPDNRPMRGDYIHHLGVGDLWVITGQSNSSGTGTGPAHDPPTLGVHLLGNDERWKLACHPLEDATRTLHPVTVHGVFQAHSPWLAFGRRLQSELGYPIGLIPTALGGSPVARWQPGADLFVNMQHMVRAAGGSVRGVVWYQGESDANPGGCDAYPERFRSFVRGLRSLHGPELPILTAQLARFTDAEGDALRNRSWTRMREIQRVLAAELGAPIVPTIDLPLCDEIHVSAAANLLVGERFAQVALRQVAGRDVAAPGIQLQRAEWVMQPSPRLRLHFDPPAAGWVKVGPIRDFTVLDKEGPVELSGVETDDRGRVDLRLGRGPAPGGVTVQVHAGCNPTVSLRDRDQRPIVAFSVEVPFP